MNSGNPKRSVEDYVQATKCEWPVYIDTDRSFEQNFGFKISLQNIHQTLVYDGSGNAQPANIDNLAPAVKQALSSAKWKIEPTEIPEILKKAWRALEFGQLGVAAPLLKQAGAASDPKVKTAALKLAAIVKDDIAARLAAEKTKEDAGDKWAAYKEAAFVAENYKEFAESKPAFAAMQKLRSDPKAAKELQAKTMLDKINMLLSSPKKSEQQTGQMGVQALLKQYPDTEAGESAKGLVKAAP